MTAKTIRFDATVDFAAELATVLTQAFASLHGDTSTIGVHIPAYGDDCEQGELVAGDAEPTRDIGEADWYVVGKDVASVVSQLQAMA
jgi:hypothetical protein